MSEPVPSLISEALRIDREPRRRSTDKPQQISWLVALARRNDGRVRVSDARRGFIADGMTTAKARNIYGNIYGILDRSPLFEHVGAGTFRLVDNASPSPLAANDIIDLVDDLSARWGDTPPLPPRSRAIIARWGPGGYQRTHHDPSA